MAASALNLKEKKSWIEKLRFRVEKRSLVEKGVMLVERVMV